MRIIVCLPSKIFIGTSDPYVKFKVGSRLLYKSKTVHKDLNPKWDETFIVPIEDPFQPINIKVINMSFVFIIQISMENKTKIKLNQTLLNNYSTF